MKTKIYSLIIICLTIMMAMSCQPKKSTRTADPVLMEKINAYATFPLTADLSVLSDKEKQLLPFLIEAAGIMDDIFWQETYGNKNELFTKYPDSTVQKFLMINYGPWERLNEDKAFLDGFGSKPAGAQFYPLDMTREEFNGFEAKDKMSLYTMVRRDKSGKLYTIPYHEFFANQVNKASDLLIKAAALSENEGFKKYLECRAAALLSDEYYASDIAWMDMKSSNIDFVIGPIENYEDALLGHKAAHEAFVLIKDQVWSQKLDRFAQLLPQLQKSLPVPDAYKREIPGSDSDLGVYDAVYYAGDCNAGSKTIAINLPNDERVQTEKGSRKLQLKNSIQAKFDQILMPVAGELMNADQ
ncbi:MAG: Zn-dependent hydrolase, partial [Bacteroidia bacterium]|nr:Zn-dependent hydrolase [Bacteroidia bacterium]